MVAALFLSRELLDFDSISTVINTALHIIVDSLVPAKFRTYALNLVIFGFQNLQVGPVRSELLRLVNIGCWEHLVDNGTREFHMAADPDRSTLWSKSAKKLSMAKGKAKEKIQFERKFFSTLIAEFQMQLNHCPEEHALVFCSRVLELFADVLSQMSTRRYLIVLFQDHLVIPICRYSRYYQENSTSDLPFFRYLNMLCDYMNFEIDNVTGLPFTRDQVSSNRHASISRWQKECFVKAPEQLEAFIFCAVGSLDDPAAVKENFERLPFEDLVSFCQITGTRHASLDGSAYSQRFLIEAIVWILQKKPHMIDIFGDESLYPTEALIFDESRVPTKPKEHIALPKAGLLYLSINDYLSRHFTSEKVAFARQLRGEITDAVLRMSPQYNLDSETPFDRTIFTGWARNAIPLIQMQVDTVGAPNLAHITPSYVTADISYSVEKYSAEITNEWDHIRAGDILILISVQVAPGFKADLSSSNNFQKTFGIKSVRGCQVHQILADDGSPVSDFISAQKMDSDGNARIESSLRCLRVLLDPNQHMQDTRGKSRGPYDSFNIVLRRNHDFAKYKLETLRDIMQSPFAHDWLEHAILGYESPQTLPAEIDFHDTFLDWSHLTETYPNVY